MQVDVSVIVVTWNVRAWLEPCLETVFAEIRRASLDAEVLVVDNASTDGTGSMVESRFPEARLIENDENLGFAAANNIGITQSSGRLVLLLNPDTELEAGALAALVRHVEEHPDVAAVGARLVGSDHEPQSSVTRFPTVPREFAGLFHLGAVATTTDYPLSRWSTAEPRTVDVIQGCCMLLRRDVLDQIGFLDEDYFLYSEEVDLCHRIHLAGWRTTWLPTSVVVHHGGQSTKQMPRTMFLELYRSKVLYFRKRHGRAQALAYKAVLLAASLARVALAPAALFESSATRRRHLDLASRYLLLLRRLWWF